MKKRIVGAFSLLGIVIGGLTFAVQSSNNVKSAEPITLHQHITRYLIPRQNSPHITVQFLIVILELRF